MPDADFLTELEQPLTMEDIAEGLARELRWNGRTIVPWSVLQHVLAGYTRIPDDQPVAQLAWLMHDAEEAVTGDIRWGWKTESQRELGETLRRTIYRDTLKLPYPEEQTLKRVDQVDEEMAAAEAHVLLHPDHARRFPLFRTGHPAIQAVWEIRDLTPRDAIHVWMGLTGDLLSNPKVMSLTGRA